MSWNHFSFPSFALQCFNKYPNIVFTVYCLFKHHFNCEIVLGFFILFFKCLKSICYAPFSFHYLSKQKSDKEGKACAILACQRNLFTQILQITLLWHKQPLLRWQTMAYTRWIIENNCYISCILWLCTSLPEERMVSTLPLPPPVIKD